MKPQLLILSNLRDLKTKKQNISSQENNLEQLQKTSITSETDHTNPPQQIFYLPKNQLTAWVKFVSFKTLDISPYVQELYESSSYQKHTFFGFNVRSIQRQILTNNKKNLYILWSLFQILNWQNLPLSVLENSIENFPKSENQIQQISIERGIIKLIKLNVSLLVDVINQKFILSPKIYQLKRQIGRKYDKSLTKITHQLHTYQFKDIILQVESNALILAVRTPFQLFLIGPNHNMKVFDIPTKDIKVWNNRCFYATNSHTIGSILLQTLFTPKLNSFAVQQTIYQDNLSQDEFFISNDKFIGIIEINIDKEFLSIRKLSQKKMYFELKLEPTSQNEKIVSKKSFIHSNYLEVLLFVGEGKDITKILEYKYYLFY